MSNGKNKSVEIDLSANGSNLYIFFGGIAARIAMPRFEFYNSAKIMDENKIFIRDFAQCWYQDGLPGISKDINGTARYIQRQMDEVKPEKTFFVGNSMGGYAAILFASLIGNGEVVAFAPQTFISPVLRLKHKDFRWKKQIYTTYRKSLFKRKVWNLKPLLLRSERSLKVSIYVSKEDQLDQIHASHISNIQGVNLYEFKSGGHEVVKLLRDEGILPAIMSGTYAS
jgi:pimeloyl-ACP methyl ester carboxylesterase